MGFIKTGAIKQIFNDEYELNIKRIEGVTQMYNKATPDQQWAFKKTSISALKTILATPEFLIDLKTRTRTMKGLSKILNELEKPDSRIEDVMASAAPVASNRPKRNEINRFTIGVFAVVTVGVAAWILAYNMDYKFPVGTQEIEGANAMKMLYESVKQSIEEKFDKLTQSLGILIKIDDRVPTFAEELGYNQIGLNITAATVYTVPPQGTYNPRPMEDDLIYDTSNPANSTFVMHHRGFTVTGFVNFLNVNGSAWNAKMVETLTQKVGQDSSFATAAGKLLVFQRLIPTAGFSVAYAYMVTTMNGATSVAHTRVGSLSLAFLLGVTGYAMYAAWGGAALPVEITDFATYAWGLLDGYLQRQAMPAAIALGGSFLASFAGTLGKFSTLPAAALGAFSMIGALFSVGWQYQADVEKARDDLIVKAALAFITTFATPIARAIYEYILKPAYTGTKKLFQNVFGGTKESVLAEKDFFRPPMSNIVPTSGVKGRKQNNINASMILMSQHGNIKAAAKLLAQSGIIF